MTATNLQTVRHYQRHPVEWVKDALGVTLTDYQEDTINALVDHRVVTVRSCHTAGKSLGAACAVLWFLHCHMGAKVVTTAPTKRQVVGILWSEIGALHRRAIRPLGPAPTRSTLHIAPDWYAIGFTSGEHAESKFQGFHAPHILVVVDEAAGVAPLIYQQVETLLSGAHPRLLLIGNPTSGDGDFYDSFRDPDASTHTVDVFSTPNFARTGITLEDIRSGAWEAKVPDPLPFPSLADPRTVARLWRKWGESSPLWDSRIMAQFPSRSDVGLIPLAWLESAAARWHDTTWRGNVRLGIDVARYGPDSTVAAYGYDQGIKAMHTAPKSDTVETAGWVGQRILADPSIAEVRIDGDGLGAGVFDMCRHEHGKKVIELRGGMQALEPDRFLNRRAEWLWGLREACEPARGNPIALPDDADLLHQLSSIRWKMTRRGLIQIESKDDMRARGMDSPDRADACAYAMATLHTTKTVHKPRLDLSGARLPPLAGLNR